MSEVRGPFIEYDCVGCGRVVQENVNMPRHKVSERIAEAHNNPRTRICAGCFQQHGTNGRKSNDGRQHIRHKQTPRRA